MLYYLGMSEAGAAAQIAEPVPTTTLPANAGINSTGHDGNLGNGAITDPDVPIFAMQPSNVTT